jgi:F-type H+-transporting ATPase subunit epsilon
MAELNIDIVAVDRKIWSGQGTFLFTRTTSGEIGILPNHIPLVAQLVDDAMVRVEREGVTVLAESAEFDSEIDEAAAQRDAESDDAATAAKGRARLRALGQID